MDEVKGMESQAESTTGELPVPPEYRTMLAARQELQLTRKLNQTWPAMQVDVLVFPSTPARNLPV